MDALGGVVRSVSLLPTAFEGSTFRLLSCFTSLFTAASLPVLTESYSAILNSPLFLQLTSSRKVDELTHTTSTQSGYSTSDLTTSSVSESSMSSLQEDLTDQRFVRFMNPVFQYDFKVGNYIPDEAKKLNPHLFMTIKDVTTGIRKSS